MRRDEAVVGGVPVDRYTWIDSAGRPRTASLKRQSGGANGGYAVQLTYEVPDGAGWRTVTADGTGGGEKGFGYFVAHERYRTFDDNSQGTIAALHGEDDSPLGLGFAVTGTHSSLSPSSTVATHTFLSTYPKWGTVAPMADVDAQTPKALAAHKKFVLPLAIQWTFQKGTDFPRIDVKLDLSEASAGQLAFDVRGPYGVLEFADGDTDASLNNVQWGDSAFHFSTESAAAAYLTTAASWAWSEPISSARKYHALLARHSTTGALYELGLIEQKLGSDPGLVYSGFADNRGRSYASTQHGLLSIAFSDSEWPFQSAQYSGVSAGAPANGRSSRGAPAPSRLGEHHPVPHADGSGGDHRFPREQGAALPDVRGARPLSVHRREPQVAHPQRRGERCAQLRHRHAAELEARDSDGDGSG